MNKDKYNIIIYKGDVMKKLIFATLATVVVLSNLTILGCGCSAKQNRPQPKQQIQK
jgi:hypothetical protein